MIELGPELARADAMLDMKRYDQACGLLSRLVAAQPESARAWCQPGGDPGPVGRVAAPAGQ
jgi:Tetratricopeptide repeat